MHSFTRRYPARRRRRKTQDARQSAEIGQGLSLAIHWTNSLSEECGQEYMNFILSKLAPFAGN